MNNQLLIFIIALAQNITIIIYVNAVFDYKYNRKFTNIFLFIFLMLLFLVTTPIINIKPLKLFFITIFQIIAYKFISTNTWWEAVKKALMLIVLDMLVELMAVGIYSFISYANNSRLDIDNASNFDTLRVLSSCFSLTYFMSAILVYILHYKKVLWSIKRRLITVLILILFAVTFIHCVIYSYNVTSFSSITLWFVCISTLVFTILPPLIYGLLLEVEKYSRKEQELEFLKQKEIMQMDYYKMMQVKEEEIRKINHDIKNNLQVICSLKNEEDKSKLIEKIDTNLKKHELIKYSKNDIFNIILNMKVNEAKSKGIDIEIILKHSINFMDDLDISDLFSNILDNAIENASCSNFPKIEFRIYKKMNYIIIKCSNSFDGIILTDDGKKIKSKKDNRHGYGLKIIDSIVKKYHGEKKISYQDNLFTITIMLLEED